MKAKRAQYGASYAGIMFFLVIAVMVLKVLSGIGGAYYDYYKINGIVASLYREGKADSEATFRRGLTDRFQINNIRERSLDDFGFNMTPSGLEVSLSYEVRSNLVGNLDMIASFDKTYSSEQFSK